MTSFSFNCPFKDPISKYILRYWGLGPQSMNRFQPVLDGWVVGVTFRAGLKAIQGLSHKLDKHQGPT